MENLSENIAKVSPGLIQFNKYLWAPAICRISCSGGMDGEWGLVADLGEFRAVGKMGENRCQGNQGRWGFYKWENSPRHPRKHNGPGKEWLQTTLWMGQLGKAEGSSLRSPPQYLLSLEVTVPKLFGHDLLQLRDRISISSQPFFEEGTLVQICTLGAWVSA